MYAIRSYYDNNQKADICVRLMEMYTNMPPGITFTDTKDPTGEMEDGIASEMTNGIEMTEEQIDKTIEAVRTTGGKIDFGAIGQIVAYLLGMYILSALFTLFMGLVMSDVAQKSVYQMRRDLDYKLSRP